MNNIASSQQCATKLAPQYLLYFDKEGVSARVRYSLYKPSRTASSQEWHSPGKFHNLTFAEDCLCWHMSIQQALAQDVPSRLQDLSLLPTILHPEPRTQ